MSYHRRCAGQNQQEKFAPLTGQEVTVELFNGMLVTGIAEYKGRACFASVMRGRLNMAYNRQDLNDSFTVGGIVVSFSSIREVR